MVFGALMMRLPTSAKSHYTLKIARVPVLPGMITQQI